MKLDSDAVVEAACALVEELGAERLTLQLLAERLGVKPPSLYNHIASLQALREAVAIRTLDRVGEALREAALGRSGEEALRAMATAYRRFAKAKPGQFRAMLEQMYGEGAVREEGRSILEIFYRALEPYGLGKAGTTHFSRAIRSAIHGFVSLEEIGFKGKPGAEESFELMVGAFIASLGSYPWSGKR
jgi:AcrR family transcriptional regulator